MDTPSVLRVLLVEDDQSIAMLLQIMLRVKNYDAILAVNGQQALDWLESETCDLILMDMHLPQVSGVETARMIRQREKADGLRAPIIALTAHVGEGDVEQCRVAGMDACIAKPTNADTLHAEIQKTLAALRRS